MIVAPECVFRQEIFQSIRSSMQELHSDKVILDDVNAAPFLFKSKDAQIWVRIFYRSMRDYSIEELQSEIRKLWVLMSNDAVLYLFYPELDRRQILKMNGFSDRLSFFEYGGLCGGEPQNTAIRICKWSPSRIIVDDPATENEVGVCCDPVVPVSFMKASRLTPEEVAFLSELSIALNHR